MTGPRDIKRPRDIAAAGERHCSALHFHQAAAGEAVGQAQRPAADPHRARVREVPLDPVRARSAALLEDAAVDDRTGAVQVVVDVGYVGLDEVRIALNIEHPRVLQESVAIVVVVTRVAAVPRQSANIPGPRHHRCPGVPQRRITRPDAAVGERLGRFTPDRQRSARRHGDVGIERDRPARPGQGPDRQRSRPADRAAAYVQCGHGDVGIQTCGPGAHNGLVGQAVVVGVVRRVPLAGVGPVASAAQPGRDHVGVIRPERRRRQQHRNPNGAKRTR